MEALQHLKGANQKMVLSGFEVAIIFQKFYDGRNLRGEKTYF
jgi:hypothetical protein